MTCSKWKMKAKCPSDVSCHSPAPVLCHSPCHLGATSWKYSLADHPNRRNQKDVTLAISVNSCKRTLRSLNLWDIVTVASASCSKGENTDAQEKSTLDSLSLTIVSKLAKISQIRNGINVTVLKTICHYDIINGLSEHTRKCTDCAQGTWHMFRPEFSLFWRNFRQPLCLDEVRKKTPHTRPLLRYSPPTIFIYWRIIAIDWHWL